MKTYTLGIISAAIVCGIIELLLDKNTIVGQLARLLSGIFIIICIISPLKNISFSNIIYCFDSVNYDAKLYTDDGKDFFRIQTSNIIKEQIEAYILDKASELDCDIAVEVIVSEENIPTPNEVIIKGKISPYKKEVLCSYIENVLGIARDKQKWS